LKEAFIRKAPEPISAFVITFFWLFHPKRPKWILLPVRPGFFFVVPPNELLPSYLLRGWPAMDEDYFRVLKPAKGKTALVVGASQGYTADRCLQMVGREGKVVAIEPEPMNVRYLRMRFRRFSNFIIVPKVATDRKGKVVLYRTPGDSAMHSTVYSRGGGSIEVEGDTIDHICLELGLREIDFMAMDVEGAEAKALGGAKKMLGHTRKVVVGAYHIVNGRPTWPEVERLLRRKGFKTLVSEDGLVHAWK
jgi:FkbM family methyltransferase